MANLVVMLASPLMEMVNGSMIEIDGGQDKPLMDRFRDKPKGLRNDSSFRGAAAGREPGSISQCCGVSIPGPPLRVVPE